MASDLEARVERLEAAARVAGWVVPSPEDVAAQEKENARLVKEAEKAEKEAEKA